MFEYEIARGALGGMCQLGHTIFGEACTLLQMAEAFQSPLNRCMFTQVLAFGLFRVFVLGVLAVDEIYLGHR